MMNTWPSLQVLMSSSTIADDTNRPNLGKYRLDVFGSSAILQNTQ